MHCCSSHWNDEINAQERRRLRKIGSTERLFLLQLYDCCHFVWDCFIINEAMVKELWYLVVISAVKTMV
jgi:hypothetical protein